MRLRAVYRGAQGSPRSRLSSPVLWVVVVVAVVVACGSGDGGTSRAGADLPIAFARALSQVSEIRGLSPPPDLRVTFVSREELPALLDTLISEEEREFFARKTTLYRLLGHFGPDEDYLSVYSRFGAAAITGLYSPTRSELWVVAETSTSDLQMFSPLAMETLAHEFVHALQEYHFALAETALELEGDLDGSLAFAAAVEGDAMVHQSLYATRAIALPFAGRLWLAGASPAARGSDVPASLLRELEFPYSAGRNWIRTVRAAGGTAAVDECLRNPPSSTAIVLHPELVATGFEPESIDLPTLGSALGQGWAWSSGGTLGEFQLRNYVETRRSASLSRAAGEGWTGDRYDVYVRGLDSLVVIRARFVSDREASEFGRIHKQLLVASAVDSIQYGGINVFEDAAGNWTAITPASETEVLFSISSSAVAATVALEATNGP